MSLLNALQNGTKTSIPSNANVNINLGDGHSTIKVTAKNANIDTGCGDQDITAVVSGDLSIDTGFCGEDKINAIVGGDASITTREDNDFINLYVGGNFKVDSGMNHPACGAEEDDDTVLIHGNLDKTDGQNYVATGQGKDNVRIIANNVDVKKADGELILGFFGDNYNINSDASKNTIGFWGDNVNMNITGQGPQDIKTLDFSFEEGRFLDFGFEKLLEQETYEGHVDNTVVTEKYTGKNNLDEIANKYNLTEEQKEQLKGLDLTKTTEKGNPYYLIYKDGDNYNIGYRDDKNNVYTLEGKKVNTTTITKTPVYLTAIRRATKRPNGFDVETTEIKIGNIDNIDIEQEKEITTTRTIKDIYNIDGVKNVNINFNNNGKYNVGITSSDGYVNINGKDACNNDIIQNILIRSGYKLEDTHVETEVSKIYEKLGLATGEITKTTKKYRQITNLGSPLILDTNGDGKVSAHAGLGVDINGDGIADGAATGGDKMLAMTDLNGNGKVDGAEVFGNFTVSPFTKKPLNAANGFEALNQIAKEAKQYTGIGCMNGSKVDVQKLAEALAKVGVKLGFVSDNNTTNVENLTGVSAIEVENYLQVKDNGTRVEHLQQGTYTNENGVTYKVDDVWFR